MPPRSTKRPQDVTGRKAEQLQEEHAEELAERAKEIGLINAVKTDGLDEPIELKPNEKPEVQVAKEVRSAKEPYVNIRLNCDLDDVTIGYGNTYNFKAGQVYRVERHIADYLDERGFVWH